MEAQDFFNITTSGGSEDIVAGISLSSRVAKILREKIRNSELLPGARLPTEQAMSQHFGVSRTVIREAMASLKRDGLVETRQGSGSFVRKSATDPVFQIDAQIEQSVQELRNLIDLRRGIEGEVAALAAQRRTPQQLQQIKDAFANFSKALEDGRDGVPEDVAFHLSLAKATENPYWVRLTNSYATQIGFGTRITRASEAKRQDYAKHLLIEHEAIVQAIEAGDAVAARLAAIKHMERADFLVTEADREFWQGEGGQYARELQAASRDN